jgi:hypothetical protein
MTELMATIKIVVREFKGRELGEVRRSRGESLPGRC